MSEIMQINAASRHDPNAEAHVEGNDIHDVHVAQGLPAYTEMTRRGHGWQTIQIAATAGLVVRPSTTAALTLFNGESATGGKSYIVDRIFTHCLVSVAAQGRFMLWACIHPQGMTAPASELAAGATNLTGMSGRTYSGNGVGVVNLALNCVDNGWFPVSSSVDWELTGVLPGAGIVVPIEGRLIVPPQGGISLQVVCSNANGTFCSGLSWYEEKLDLVL